MFSVFSREPVKKEAADPNEIPHFTSSEAKRVKDALKGDESDVSTLSAQPDYKASKTLVHWLGRTNSSKLTKKVCRKYTEIHAFVCDLALNLYCHQ